MLAFVRLLLMPVGALGLFVALVPIIAVICLGSPGVVTLLQNPIWVEATLRSLLLAEAAIVVGWPVGLSAALGLWGARRATRRLVLTAGLVPLLVPSAWISAGLKLAAHRSGLQDAALLALLLGQAAQAAGIVLLVMTGFLNRLDPGLMRSAAACGASALQARLLILLPNVAMPLALSAAAGFAVSLGGTMLDRTLAPPGHPSLGALLAAAVQAGDSRVAPAALVLLAMAAIPLAVTALLPLLRRRAA